MKHELNVKRVYLPAEPQDGQRILVDRLWPRGISKDKAQLAEWDKSIGPSSELRKWFGHQAERFPEFADRYVAELEACAEAHDFATRCLALLEQSNVTLLFGAHDETHNQAVVLKDWILKQRNDGTVEK